VRATVKDVAARAGVSPKTVSNVINGKVFVKPETRERVESALADLEYVPNLSARGLRNGRSGVIALALPDLATAYSSEMAHFFVESAHARGWAVQIEETAFRPRREDELMSQARANLIDGLILNPIILADSAVARSSALPPVVLIGEVEQTVTDQVWLDPIAAASDMTEYLIGRGARRIAIVGAPAQLNTATARLRTVGYRAALNAAGIPLDERLEISCASWTPRCGAESVAAFLAQGYDLPDAFFCFTDSLAIGALSALSAAGIRTPADTMVAGFDDVAEGEFASPPLTTVGFDKRAYADAALDLLTARIADRSHPPALVTIPHRLVLRASTGEPRS
jgi:DNA-binding LacI/PurR family transcriptional regulator